MHKFEVWAPFARTVDVSIEGSAYPLKKGERDVWCGTVENAGPGTEYGFIIDGQEPAIPDPRSPWQPNGVNGLSRVVDHDAFPWTDKDFQARPLSSGVVYELHVGTFTPEGTLDAAISRLDYLKDLGITHVELMPLASFSGDRGWGYDGVALYAPHQAYGGPDALKRFIDAAHGKGLGVLHDVVYNHFGPSGNYTGKYGPYITENHRTPWGGAVNLEDEHSDQVRRFFCDNALMWLRDYHFDGLRLDAVHALMDRSAIHFLEQLADEVRALSAQVGRHLVLIAESDLNDPRLVHAKEAGGYGMDAQWSDDFHHALWTLLVQEGGGYYEDFGTFQKLSMALKGAFVYRGQYSSYRKRKHGRPVQGLAGYHFLGFIQNHDQVGNRATGERLGQLAGEGRAKIAAAIVLTAPFVPMLFEGEEFAASTPFQYFTDFHDQELGRLVSEGRKKEFAAFGWKPEDVPDPQDRQTFERSKLKWDEIAQEPHASMLQWHKDLIALRRASLSLLDGDLEEVSVRFDEDAHWIVIERREFVIAANFGSAKVEIPIPRSGKVVLRSVEQSDLQGEKVHLEPESVVIVKMSPEP